MNMLVSEGMSCFSSPQVVLVRIYHPRTTSGCGEMLCTLHNLTFTSPLHSILAITWVECLAQSTHSTWRCCLCWDTELQGVQTWGGRCHHPQLCAALISKTSHLNTMDHLEIPLSRVAQVGLSHSIALSHEGQVGLTHGIHPTHSIVCCPSHPTLLIVSPTILPQSKCLFCTTVPHRTGGFVPWFVPSYSLNHLCPPNLSNSIPLS